MNHLLLIFLLVLFASAQAGVYSRQAWNTSNLTVCYAVAETPIRHLGVLKVKIASWSSPARAMVKNWVEAEYSSERTGIHFSGWSPCEEDPQADIVLFLGKEGGLLGGQASLGPRNPGTVARYPNARGYVLIYDLKKSTVVHEFGHVAGLMHEHLHPQIYQADPTCAHKLLNSPPRPDSLNEYVTYDRQSVMNYCALNAPGGENLGLSPGDLGNLQELYLNDNNYRD